MDQTIVNQIEAAMEVKPTVVLSIWSHAYAQTDGNTAGLRAGVRGNTDWEIELEGCSIADAEYLDNKYGVNDTHYMVDDESVGRDAYAEAVAEFEANLPEPTPTMSLTEFLCTIVEATDLGAGIKVTFDGATWLVVR